MKRNSIETSNRRERLVCRSAVQKTNDISMEEENEKNKTIENEAK